MEEVWKDINGTNGNYSISNFGNVRSNPRLVKGRDNEFMLNSKILHTFLTKEGYKMTTIQVNKRSKPIYVSKVVAEHFIDNPYNLIKRKHIDGDLSNCHSQNIEYIPSNNLKIGMYNTDGKLLQIHFNIHDLSDDMNISTNHLYLAMRKKQYCRGFIFYRHLKPPEQLDASILSKYIIKRAYVDRSNKTDEFEKFCFDGLLEVLHKRCVVDLKDIFNLCDIYYLLIDKLGYKGQFIIEYESFTDSIQRYWKVCKQWIENKLKALGIDLNDSYKFQLYYNEYKNGNNAIKKLNI